MNFIESALVSLGQDELINRGQEFAGEHFQPTKDPFYETESNGKKHRRKMPDYVTKEESKNWISIQNKAWLHDKGLCGCCCWAENIGWAPFLAIFPIIGPALMYSVHSKLIKLADKKYNLPPEMMVKMYSNIAIDLCISLIPILGSVFAWLNACSTRNAAMIYNFVCERALDKYNNDLKVQQLRQDAVTNKIMKEKSSMKRNERINNSNVNEPERAKTKINIQQREVSSTSINDGRQKENRQPYSNANNNNGNHSQRTPYPVDISNQNNNRDNTVPTNRQEYSQQQQYNMINENYNNNNNNRRYQHHPQQQYAQYQQNQYQQRNQYQQQNSYPQTQYQQNQYIPMQNMQAPQRSYHPQR